MKTLNQIRYFLFATTVLGCFANFAQNEYGLTILYYSQLFIALIFFAEAFVFYNQNSAASKTKALYLFIEHFLLGCLFLGQFFKWEFILPPGPFLIFSALLLFILYLVYGIRMLVKDSKKGGPIAIMVFLFIIAAVLSMNSLSWKLQHLPGSNMMLRTAFFLALFLVLINLIKRKYSYDGELISIKERMMKLPGKLPMVFVYFTLWITYITLITYDVAPNFYTLATPPALEKLKQSNNPKEWIYSENYYQFLQNRNHIQYR